MGLKPGLGLGAGRRLPPTRTPLPAPPQAGSYEGQPVAVKMVLGAGGVPAELAALRLEVSILSRVDHPNVLRLLGGNLRPPNVRRQLRAAGVRGLSGTAGDGMGVVGNGGSPLCPPLGPCEEHAWAQVPVADNANAVRGRGAASGLCPGEGAAAQRFVGSSWPTCPSLRPSQPFIVSELMVCSLHDYIYHAQVRPRPHVAPL